MSITTDAQDLFEKFTVAQLRDMIQTEGGVAAPSKLRKHELAQYLADIRHNQAKEERLAEQAAEARVANGTEPDGELDPLPVGNVPLSEYHPKYRGVFQGAMHEATTRHGYGSDAVHPENPTALAAAASILAPKVERIEEATRKAAQALVPVAFRNLVATVQSMGRTVRGKVAAVELRTPDADGSGRVLLVVQHDGHPHRRTLHRLVDVNLEPVTS